jgi:hypothetical protein
MPVQMKDEPNDICVLRISGILKRSEFGAEERALAREIDIGSKPRLLVILENFEAWERGADWSDLDCNDWPRLSCDDGLGVRYAYSATSPHNTSLSLLVGWFR